MAVRCCSLEKDAADKAKKASYNASKAALHAYGNTLRAEMKPFGLVPLWTGLAHFILSGYPLTERLVSASLT